tara:strand:+ start:11987 stop:13126 length:1140 start_codon:yes stop_codon:yes gene_type:complete
MTESIFAEGIDSTFTTGTGGQTAPFDTGSVVRAGDIGVDVSITIIIDPIAHFLFGFLCVTGAPCALLTALNTLTTFAFAGTDELFVDLTIAVVVFSITDFGGWENVGDTWLPGIIFTGLFASTTCSGAGLRFAFFAGLVAAIIDCAIAVFVFSVVTDLRFGQDLVLTGLAPSACLTGLYTIPTQAFFAGVFGACVARSCLSRETLTCDAIVDFTVTVVIFSVTDFRCGLQRDLVERVFERCFVVRLVILTGPTCFCHACQLRWIHTLSKAYHVRFDCVRLPFDGDRTKRFYVGCPRTVCGAAICHKEDKVTSRLFWIVGDEVRAEILSNNLHRFADRCAVAELCRELVDNLAVAGVRDFLLDDDTITFLVSTKCHKTKA